MSLQDLSLPIDIPWKLIATSNDMLANHANRFPNAMWKSSLAIFAYNPDLSDLPDVFSDRELTFLKVVASITSYAPPCADLPAPPDPAQYGEEFQAYDDAYAAWRQTVAALKQLEHETYPCSGALVQVGIYPREGDTTDVTKLAYLTAMEPQKRELIEVATESGESMTQSKSDVNIRKGITNTNSTEDLNVFTGMNVSAQVGGSGGSFGLSGQFGQIKRTTSEVTDTTTTDTSREKRETASHSTNLSQLYHLLNSYHLGTNRAIFFLQPRPHTVQQKERFTFINGPQEIEGIQEFFLVVSRPNGAGLEQYCVDALLYTAHLDQESMRTALVEPKTAETPWLDLWATARVLSQPDMNQTVFDSHRSTGLTLPYQTAGVSDPVNLQNIPPLDIAAADAWAAEIDSSITLEDPAAAVISRAQTKDPIQPVMMPGVLNQVISTAVLRAPTGTPSFVPEPGWRIDRTRGLGGYDLWEDPNNYSATPLGKKSDVPPQGFVDILSWGSLNDLTSYLPDCAARIRAIVWPDGQVTDGMYHARIKVYFIRDDTPANGRTIPMFITARGVSTCTDSPFAQFYATSGDPSKLPADIAAEGSITPTNQAPWSGIEQQQSAQPVPVTPTASQPQSAGSTTDAQPAPPASEKPLNSARPSGLDPVAVGAARVKMANGIANDVRRQLKSMMTCPQMSFTAFRYSDFAFQAVAKKQLVREATQLAADTTEHTGLANFVAAHRAAAGMPIRVSPPSGSRLKSAQRPPAKLTAYPALTLAYLSPKETRAFHKAGVRSAMDLLDLPLAELAHRLGVDAVSAARDRLKAVGMKL